MLLYTTPDGEIRVEALLYQENVWLSQKKMADLFGVDSDTVGYHLKNIYETLELSKDATAEYFAVVQQE